MDTVFLALRVIVSLGAVFGALWFAHRWITKGRPGLRLQPKAIAVAARQGLGAKAGVAIVEADGRRYLLGVTEHAVTVLDRLDPGAPEQQTTFAVLATGPVPAPPTERGEARVVSVVTTGPVPAPPSAASAGLQGNGAPGLLAFEQQLAAAAAITAAIAVPPEPAHDVLRIQPTAPTPVAAPLTRRAALAAESAAARPQSTSPLAGSILSPDTWRQTAAALKRAK